MRIMDCEGNFALLCPENFFQDCNVLFILFVIKFINNISRYLYHFPLPVASLDSVDQRKLRIHRQVVAIPALVFHAIIGAERLHASILGVFGQ